MHTPHIDRYSHVLEVSHDAAHTDLGRRASPGLEFTCVWHCAVREHFGLRMRACDSWTRTADVWKLDWGRLLLTKTGQD
jgi:hypothetical protein